MRRLNLREEAFCEAYVRCAGSADAAFREAGYRGAGNSGKLVARPEVRARIEAIRANIAQEHKDLRERILAELEAIAFSNVADHLSHDGSTVTIFDLGELTRSQAAVIESVTQVETASKPALRVKFHDKLQALDKLNKMLGHYRDEDLINRRPFVVRVPFVAASTPEWLEDHTSATRLPEPPQLEDLREK
jgi:phage terminase small subunit